MNLHSFRFSYQSTDYGGLGALDGLWGVQVPSGPGVIIVFAPRTEMVHVIGYAVAAASGTTLLLGSLLWGIGLRYPWSHDTRS